MDDATWPPPPGPPSFPAGFHTGASNVDIDVTAMLLLIGHLTTPTTSAGVSLSEFWAWVRYFYAIGPSADLRLTEEFADLDAHQKTILSDDFGMGLPMYWLASSLGLGPTCDGRYFIERHAASVGAAVVKTAKRGPNKSPDFVSLDAGGRWHIIECKGTQSGPEYRNRQLSHDSPNGVPSGALVQKQTINFPSHVQGQKLACGVAIAREGQPDATHLRIIDPEEGEKYSVREHDLGVADDPPIRATLARILRLSGFDVAASAIIAPSGRYPNARPAREQVAGRLELERRAFVEARRERARDELSRREGRRRFTAHGTSYIGRKLVLDLPKPLLIDNRAYRRVTIRQGLKIDIPDALADDALAEGPIGEGAPWLRERLGEVRHKGERIRAELTVGSVYYSDIKLSRR